MTRRGFLGAMAMAGAGCALETPLQSGLKQAPLDFHVHLFGIGDGGTGCRLSQKQREHWNFRFLLKLLRLEDNGKMDQQFVAELARQLRASSTGKAVLLAQDARYDQEGKPDFASTNAYVPNDYLFQVVREHPHLFVPCASINPKRRDAMDELDRCADLGARVVKVHPPTQVVNPSDDRFRPWYRRLAERRVILMVHTGSEHASEAEDPSLSDPAHLLPALEEGCTVVAAHSGMGSFLDRSPFRDDFLRHLIDLAERFPTLYCDTAVLTSLFRWPNLPRLLDEPSLAGRIVYASDWPFTSNAMIFWNRLRPADLLSFSSETNLFERDYSIKRALGLTQDAFERGVRLLHAGQMPSAALLE
jgi:predicted TIM-barrel fold metal-dependent hydrolase